MALLGSDTFDVDAIDVTTLAFGPGKAGILHRRDQQYRDVNKDGFMDLVSHYPLAEAGIAPDADEACLTGKLTDETPFEGCDRIRIVPAEADQGATTEADAPCGLGFELVLLLPPLMWLHRARRGSLH